MPDLANSAQQQDLALRAALEAMDREAYSKAANYLSYILKIDQQTDVAAQAYFWQAEVNMRAYDYPSALESLQKLEPHYKLLPKRLQQLRHYQKAYAFFKTKAYDKAVVEFRQFESIAQGGESLSFEYQETLVRLADAYYSMGDFKNALIYYNRTLNEVPKLKAYAAFNGAMAMGLMGLLDQKIERLKGFERISVSPRYYPKALLELGMAYAAQDEPSLAIESFDKLISLFPTSAEVPDAMLKKAFCFTISPSLKRHWLFLNRWVKPIKILTPFLRPVSLPKEFIWNWTRYRPIGIGWLRWTFLCQTTKNWIRKAMSSSSLKMQWLLCLRKSGVWKPT